jgi:hypothetical protein
MSHRPNWTRAVLLTLSLIVAAPLAAFAQDARVRVPERMRHRDRMSAVALPATVVAAEFTLAPAAPVRARAVRRAPARAAGDLEAPPAPPVPPDPMAPETMDLLSEALGGGGFGGAGAGGFQNPGPPVLDHIELSARQTWANEKGYLDFLLPYDINPATPSINFNKNFPGRLTVRLKVEEGKTYLVDFAVSSWGSGTYSVETSGGEQEFDDPQGNLEHVLVALNATESGWTDVRFDRTGTGHYLYTVTVDRME